MAATDPVRNFAKVAVAQGYAAGVTSILLASSDPNIGQIPDPASVGQYNLVWWNNTTYADPADDPNREIIRVTAKTSYTLTILRAQESTADTAKNTTGCTYRVVMAPTQKFRDDLETAIVEYGPLYGTVREYGAVGDGSTDDYAAINSAKTALTHIVFPSGTYRIGTSITFGSSKTIEFLQGASLEPDAGVTVTIQGQVIAGNDQIFQGSGTVTADSRHSTEYGRWWGLTTDPDFLCRGALKATTGLRDGLSWQSGSRRAAVISTFNSATGGGAAGSCPGNASFRAEDFSPLTLSAFWRSNADSFTASYDGRFFYITDTGADNTTCKVARFDTTVAWDDGAPPWEATDIQDYLSDVYYLTGSCFDGRYLYFMGTSVATDHLDNLVRYDTQAPFATAGSWAVKHLGAVDTECITCWSLLFDGRYVYGIDFSPAGSDRKHFRYDTTEQFSENASYEVMSLYDISTSYTRYYSGCFDGRYIYLTPQRTTGSYNYAARYDTTASYTSSGSWSFFDLDTLVGSTRIPSCSCICDGRYVYFAPYYTTDNADCRMARYDTTMDFTSADAWTTFKTKDVTGSNVSYTCTFSDGRNIYFASTSNKLLVYDRWKPFGQTGSWQYCSPATLTGSTETFAPDACVSDGTYVYFNDSLDYYVWRFRLRPESGFLQHPARPRQQIDGWYQDNVAASQSAVLLTRLSGGCTDAFVTTGPGSITKVAVYSNAARSAGTLTVEVYVNGSATGLQAILDGTNTTFDTGEQTSDKDTFVAGDRIDVRITTDGSWAPTTADIRASVELET